MSTCIATHTCSTHVVRFEQESGHCPKIIGNVAKAMPRWASVLPASAASEPDTVAAAEANELTPAQRVKSLSHKVYINRNCSGISLKDTKIQKLRDKDFSSEESSGQTKRTVQRGEAN